MKPPKNMLVDEEAASIAKTTMRQYTLYEELHTAAGRSDGVAQALLNIEIAIGRMRKQFRKMERIQQNIDFALDQLVDELEGDGFNPEMAKNVAVGIVRFPHGADGESDDCNRAYNLIAIGAINRRMNRIEKEARLRELQRRNDMGVSE